MNPAAREAAAEVGIAIPILPSKDLSETRAFFEALGFHAAGWWPDFGYASLVRGDITVHFTSFDELTPADNYAQCYWRVKDPDGLHTEFTKAGLPTRGIPRLDDIGDKPWGMREFAVVDPSGNLIRIGRAIQQ